MVMAAAVLVRRHRAIGLRWPMPTLRERLADFFIPLAVIAVPVALVAGVILVTVTAGRPTWGLFAPTRLQALDVAAFYQGQATLEPDEAVLVVFFETWCGPCRAEAPHVQRLADTFGPKGLEVVAVTAQSGSSEADVRRWIRSTGWTVPVARDGGLRRQIGGSGVPYAAVIVDQRVVWQGHPGLLSDRLVASLLTPEA